MPIYRFTAYRDGTKAAEGITGANSLEEAEQATRSRYPDLDIEIELHESLRKYKMIIWRDGKPQVGYVTATSEEEALQEATSAWITNPPSILRPAQKVEIDPQQDEPDYMSL